MKPHPPEHYIPALSFRILTPIYDPLMNLAMRNGFYIRKLIDQAQLEPGMSILDVGCGTGTLITMIKQSIPQVQASALDGDSQILEIAAKKAQRAGLEISFDLGMANALPYPDQSFDRVFSSMMMHHLGTEDKIRMIKEVFRVLIPGGQFHLVDFGVPANAYDRLVFGMLQRLERVQDNIKGRITDYIRSGGFTQVEETGRSGTFFGSLSYFRAIK